MSTYALSPAEHAILELEREPYDWQIEGLESIGEQEFGGLPTSVVAANGSGKTSDLVAVAVSWFMRRFPNGWCIITSGSWNQLKNQLWPSLSALRGKNPGWKVRSGSECSVTTKESRETGIGGVIGFSTNDPKRAEGWHPKPGMENPVMIIVDEAKGVPDGIFDAFDRCTALFRLYVSSPGGPSGRFYDSHHELRSLFHCIKVPSSLCPHIKPEKIARDIAMRGLDDPVLRSMHFAEFTEGNDLLIINPMLVAKALQETLACSDIPKKEDLKVTEITAFCDFAAGRDENVIALCDGRRAWIHDAWIEADPVQGARQCIAKLAQLAIPAHRVWGDADGLGIGFVKQMWDQGYYINEFRGGLPAVDEEHYCSTISEAWFEDGRKIARGEIVLCGDLARGPTTIRQLTTRKSEWNEKNLLRAEKKENLAKRGIKSPDRGDALICAINRHFYTGGAFTEKTAKAAQIGESPFASGIVTGF